MMLVVAALLVLGLAVGALCWQLMVLEREIRRQGVRADHRHVELEARIQALNAWFRVLENAVNENEDQRKKDVAILQAAIAEEEIALEKAVETNAAALAEDARTAEALRGVWEALKPLPEMAEGVRGLLARDDASESVKRLEKLLADAPEVLGREEESRLSREMQEGVENLLNYFPGQAREGGV